MQVTELSNDKLKYAYRVTVPAATLEQGVTERLTNLAKTIKMPGFRPGKVPLEVVRKSHGQSVLGEVLDMVVRRSVGQAIKEKGVQPAMEPKIEILDFKEGSDLTYKMEFEILPISPEVDFSKISITKLKAVVTDKDLDEAASRFAMQQKSFEPVAKPRAAKKGDAVKIDFKGMIGGKAFDGGSAKGHTLELGGGQFIPGFEEQLIGAKAGEERVVKVPFPKDYHRADLAGVDAEFHVTVHEVLEAKAAKVDDAFAGRFGFPDLATLKKALREQLEQDANAVARSEMKRELFDVLNEKYPFEIPSQLVQMEFDNIWQQIEHLKKDHPNHPEVQKPDDVLKKEYRKVAERRVRLGILLAQTGSRENISINQEELQRALQREASNYPGQEKKIYDFYRQNPDQIERFKGPIIEEKVVDVMISRIKGKEKEMSLDALRELNSDDEDALAHDHHHDHAHENDCGDPDCTEDHKAHG